MGAEEASSPGADTKPAIDDDQTQQSTHITLNFVSQERTTVPIKVKRSTTFAKMFVAYRDKFHLSEQDVRFVANGSRLKPFHTPGEHELEDGDEIEAILEMLGGC